MCECGKTLGVIKEVAMEMIMWEEEVVGRDGGNILKWSILNFYKKSKI